MDTNVPATPAGPENSPRDDVGETAAKGPTAREPSVSAPARPTGPNASAIVVGLLAMIFGGLTIAKETMGWHLDWSRLGPGGIIGIGVVMVVIGAVGLVRRHDDV
jgi:hypothetical protein